jgi:pimeloyl-ACP methyl ester carboxylesterase
VLFVGAAGPVDRDGNLSGAPVRTDAMRQLAESLAVRGIASVRYDKRGVGASAKAMLPEHQMTFEVFAHDAAAMLYELRRRALGPVIMLGVDEGAFVAALSQRDIPADGYILIGGPSRSADELLREQIVPGKPPEVVATIDSLIKALRADSIVDRVPFQLTQIFRPTLQPYLISWMRYHPAAELSRVGRPCLLLRGAHDLQQSAAEADTLAKAQPFCLRATIDSMTHTLKRGGSEPEQQERAWREPTEPLAPGLARTIADFVSLITAKPPASCGGDSLKAAVQSQLLIERPVTAITPNSIAVFDDVYLGRYSTATIPATMSESIASATLVSSETARRYGPTAAKCGLLRLASAEWLAADSAEILGAVLKGERESHTPRLEAMLTLMDSVTSSVVRAPLHRALVRRNVPIASSLTVGDDTVTVAFQSLERASPELNAPAIVKTRVRWSTIYREASAKPCRLRYDVFVMTEVRRANGKWRAERTTPELKSIGGCVPLAPGGG